MGRKVHWTCAGSLPRGKSLSEEVTLDCQQDTTFNKSLWRIFLFLLHTNKVRLQSPFDIRSASIIQINKWHLPEIFLHVCL